MVCIINEDVLLKVVPARAKEDSTLREREKDIQREYERIQAKFENLSRFHVPQYAQAVSTLVTANDGFISETDRQADAHLRRAQMLLDAAKEAAWPTENDPYHSVYLEISDTLMQAYASISYLNWDLDILIDFSKRLLSIIEQLKDTEIETVKMDKEKSFYEKVFTDYQLGIQERDKRLMQMTERIIEQSKIIDELHRDNRARRSLLPDTMQPQHDAAADPLPLSPEPDSPDELQILERPKKKSSLARGGLNG